MCVLEYFPAHQLPTGIRLVFFFGAIQYNLVEFFKSTNTSLMLITIRRVDWHGAIYFTENNYNQLLPRQHYVAKQHTIK